MSRGSAGGSGPADAECTFGYRRDGAYYLLRWHSDGDTSIYRSDDPLNFGVDSDAMRVATLPVEVARIIEGEGRSYLTSLRPDLRGIRLAHLTAHCPVVRRTPLRLAQLLLSVCA